MIRWARRRAFGWKFGMFWFEAQAPTRLDPQFLRKDTFLVGLQRGVITL